MATVCYNCFHYMDEEGRCPLCGYDPGSDAGKHPHALQPGTMLAGRYYVGRVLGQGGFGITYAALDGKTRSRVAIKEYLPSELAGRTQGTQNLQIYSIERNEEFAYGKQQFLEEAKTLSAFEGNEHIVRILDSFEENGTAYFAMEFMEGVDLKKYMLQNGRPLQVHEANRILLPIMEALDWVHSKGMIHRDISPDNIMVKADGTAKLIDFGSARMSTSEKSKSLDVVLKHGFAPREQYTRRGRQGPYTDVYAMAATYYYAITGKVPPDALERTEEDNLKLPSTQGAEIRPETEAVLMKALAISAQDRYQTMAEFYRAMLTTMPHPFSPEAGVSDPEKAKKILEEEERKKKGAGKKSKLPLVAVLAIVILGAAIGGWKILGTRSTVSDNGGTQAESDLKETAEAEVNEQAEPIAAETETAENMDEAAQTAIEPDDVVTLSVGDVVTFGQYVQGLDEEKADPIEWIVLESHDHQALLISKYGLEAMPFHGPGDAEEKTEDTLSDWEHCTLRKWLNSDFLSTAFNEKEQTAILTTVVDNSTGQGNGDWNINGTGNTEDKIYVLSYAEAENYFYADDGAVRVCMPSTHAKALGAYAPEDQYGAANWWLRSPGPFPGYTAFCSYIFLGYTAKENEAVTVRPALQVDLTSEGLEELTITDDKWENVGLQNKEESEKELLMPGSTVYFGSYEQDANIYNGTEPIEWLVLDQKDDELLLISKDALEAREYNTKKNHVTWENCTLRTWLNNDFLNTAFHEEEKAGIVETEVDNSGRQGSERSSQDENNTYDKIYLLSWREAEQYFAREAERTCEYTAYISYKDYFRPDWWLRTPMDEAASAGIVIGEGSSYVNEDTGKELEPGTIVYSGVQSTQLVRPVLWVNRAYVYAELPEEPKTEYKTLLFGNYEQDNNPENGTEPIEWFVLDTQENQTLLLSKYALNALPYSEGNGSTSFWEGSSVRKWLNGDFFEKAFSEEERAAIQTTNVSNGKEQGNTFWNASIGNNTNDGVFLLSYMQASTYCPTNNSRQCFLTPAALAHSDPHGLGDLGGQAYWWLRSPGSTLSSVATVSAFGDIRSYGAQAEMGVRPAIWVDMTAKAFGGNEEGTA